MTDDDGGLRRKVTRPFSSVAAWLRKRRERANVADLAAKVAASAAAKVIAATFVTVGAAAGVASIPDVLDGADGRPVAQQQPLSAEAVDALAADTADLRAALDALTSDLAALPDAPLPVDLAPVVADLAAVDSRLLSLAARVIDVERALDDVPIPQRADLGPVSDRVDAVVTDLIAARAQADAAALLAGQVADDLMTTDETLAGVALDVADVADSLHLLAADLASIVDDVVALAVRVATLEADVTALDDRVVQTEALTTDATYAAFIPQALAGQQRGEGPTFTTRAESLATVTVRTTQGGEQPAATIYVVRTDGPFTGTDWSSSPATVGNVVHVALLPAGDWRIDVECDQPCNVGTGLVIVQPVGTFTPVP